MQSLFNESESVEQSVPVETTATPEKKARTEKMQAMKQALKETVQSTPDFTERLRRLSSSLKVVNTLGYGVGGNILQDKNAKKETGERVLKATSQIVGYKVQNIGTEAIEYTTEVYSQDESGKFVGQVVTKTIAPGETINLTRQYMTMLCARPEISFTLSNGKIVASSKKNAKNLKEELSAYYFSFNKDENGVAPQVNDDEVKLAVDVKGTVKPEYLETFGYLNNPKAVREPKAKGNSFSVQDLAANYINKLIESQGVQ